MLSPCAVGGAIAGILFPIACLMAALGAATSGSNPTETRELIVSTLAVLAVISAVTSCALGLAGIRQIRAPGGRYYGLKLALLDTLAYPLVLLDLIFVFVVMCLLQPHGEDADRISLLIGAVALALDIWIVRRIWRHVSRGPDGRSPRRESLQPPARPIQPSSRAYSLPPKRGLSGPLAILAVALGLFLIVLFLIFVYAMRRERAAAMEARAQAMEMQAREIYGNQAVIRPDVPAHAGQDADPHTFRFEIHAPLNWKTTIWAELWKDGKLQTSPGFNVTQWVFPPNGLGFDGSATFEMEPGQGKVMMGWRIDGNAGGVVSEEPMDDPFAGMTLRDSTWGRWTDSRAVSLGRPLQLLALRGDKQQLTGSADDERLKGRAAVEVRLFARFDKMTPDDQRRGPLMGSSPHVPAGRVERLPPADPFKTRPALPPPDGADERPALPPSGGTAPDDGDAKPASGLPATEPSGPSSAYDDRIPVPAIGAQP